MRETNQHLSRIVAVHEAGHVIVARHEGVPVAKVSIIPDRVSRGHVFHGEDCGGHSALSMALVGIAGITAEWHFFPGRAPTGLGKDVERALLILEFLAVSANEDPGDYLKAAKDCVNDILTARAGDVLAVAVALVQRQELTASQIDDVLSEQERIQSAGLVVSNDLDGNIFSNAMRCRQTPPPMA